jgi:hypothetical protein
VSSLPSCDVATMDSDSENVVPPRRRDSVDEQISDLVRVADLAMHVWLSEQEEEITDDGSVLQIILEDIQQRAKKLRARHRDPGDDTA